MNRSQTAVALFLMFGLLMAGCTQVKTRVRQDDGTYREQKRTVLRSDLPGLSFTCDEDYMVVHEIQGVTYTWPKGRGSLARNFNEITFENSRISCRVVGRELWVNESRFAAFEKGDRVRIAGDGKVFVNDVERKPLGAS